MAKTWYVWTIAEAPLVNNVMLIVDTGTNLALVFNYSGQSFYVTVGGGGYALDDWYIRDSTNSSWLELNRIAYGTTLLNKTIDASLNTLSNLGTSAFANNAVTAPKLASAITQFSKATYNTTQTTTSASYADVTSSSVTITANGNRAGLIAQFVGGIRNSAAGNTVTTAITDGSGTVKQEIIMVAPSNSGTTNITRPAVNISAESAPSAGSLTRKAQWKTSAGTATMGSFASTNYQAAIYVQEVL